MSTSSASGLRRWLGKRKNWTQILLPLALVVGLFVLGRTIDVDRGLQSVRAWLWEFGPWGPLVYALLYVGATLLLLPGTPFTVVAALLFGSLWGFVTMLAATTVAASAAFLLARHGAREAVERRIGDSEAFASLRSLVEENHRIAIPFVRLAPFFPFALNNYALGLTRISFWSYLLWSEIVFLPMTAVLVLGSGVVYRATIKGEASWKLIALSTAAGLVVLGLGALAKRRLGGTSDAAGAQKP